MIVRKQRIRFDGNRVPVPSSVRVGYESDHLVERLIFEVPQVDEEQSVFLVLSGEYADVAMLERDADGRYFVDLTAEMLGEGGAVDCYVQVRGADGTVWNSGVLRMRVGELPDADGDLVDREPTIVEQVTQAAQRAETVMIERMCPPFEESGTVVRCHPVAGSALGVVSGIEAVQAGTGDPSPENVRAISGHAGVVLTVNGADRSAQFGQTVYGGTYDWQSGVLTVTHRMVTVSPATHLVEGKTYGCIIKLPDARKSASAKENDVILAADRLKITGFNPIYAKSEQFAVAGLFDVAGIAIRTNAEMDNNQEAIRAWLAANPVTVVYKLAEPYEVQLEGTVITAAEGENVLMSSTGNTTVSGRSNPAWVIGKLAARVAALEAAIVNGN